MPYTSKGKCVYKKDTGKKVGCTQGPVKDYLAALHANVDESKCSSCGGDGWHVEPDEKGEPQQVQCYACCGQGGHKDPEPNLRPSGEPKNEPFNESTMLNESPKKSKAKVATEIGQKYKISPDRIVVIGDEASFYVQYTSLGDYAPDDVPKEHFYDMMDDTDGAWLTTKSEKIRSISKSTHLAWRRMDSTEKRKFYSAIWDYLNKLYGEEEFDESTSLSEILKKIRL